MTSARPVRTRLIELVDKLSAVSVCVIGDPVLDEFEYGEIARVSREAPVLILDHRRSDLVCGGAGNTASNLSALGIRVSLLGRIGDDERGARLRELLAAANVDIDSLVPEANYATPTKTRILAGSPHTAKQQIVRIDRGQRDLPLSSGVRETLRARAVSAAADGSAIVLADYGYGVVDPSWLEVLNSVGGPITLDSRFSLLDYSGVDAATPNLEEVERSLDLRLQDGDEEALAAAGRELRRRIDARAVLVTRGSRGMSLFEERQPIVHLPAFGSDEVADVTGAGDTVIAMFTAVRAAGGSWREAAELANVAGGLVVMKRGTATINPQELVAALQERWS